MNEKRTTTINLTLVLVIVLAVAVLLWQRTYLEKETQRAEQRSVFSTRKTKGMTPAPEPDRAEKLGRKLFPSRPEDYGMVVTSDFDKPKTQEGWDTFLHQKLSKLETQVAPQTLEKIRIKIKEDPEKTREKLVKIEEGIKWCRETLNQDPGNKEVLAKLERLMILKSLAKEFQDF